MDVLRSALEVLKGATKGQWYEHYYKVKRQKEYDSILRFYGLATRDGYGDPNFQGIKEYWYLRENIEKHGEKVCKRMSAKLLHPMRTGSFLLMNDFAMDWLLKLLPNGRQLYEELFLFAYKGGIIAYLPHELKKALRQFRAVPGFLFQGYMEDYTRYVNEFYDSLLNSLSSEERRLIGGSIIYVGDFEDLRVMDVIENKVFDFYPFAFFHVGGIKGYYYVFYADYQDVLRLIQNTKDKPPEAVLSVKAFGKIFTINELIKEGKITDIDGFVGWSALVGVGRYGEDQRVVVLVDGGQALSPEWLPTALFEWQRVGSQDWHKKFKAIWRKNMYLSTAFVLFLKENADYFNGKIDYLPYALMVSVDKTKEKDYWHFYTPVVKSPVRLKENVRVNLLDGWGGMSGREVRKLYAMWIVDGVMLSTAQAREVLNYIKAVNDSVYIQFKKNDLNSIRMGNIRLSEINEVIYYLLSRNPVLARGFESNTEERNEVIVFPMPPYLIGTYDFFASTESEAFIQRADMAKLVELVENQTKIVDLREELMREEENRQDNKV